MVKETRRLDKGEKTLLVSLLLSMWAPLATAIAMVMSRSVTQLADFLRRSIELLALLLSWLVYRFLAKGKQGEEARLKWERIVNCTLASALAISGLLMMYLASVSFFRPPAKGNALLGLSVALLGFLVNLFFWIRYSRLAQEGHGAIIKSQSKLYLAKLVVDICVILALGSVVCYPTSDFTNYIDVFGSLVVSLYLLFTAIRLLVKKD